MKIVYYVCSFMKSELCKAIYYFYNNFYHSFRYCVEVLWSDCKWDCLTVMQMLCVCVCAPYPVP